MPLPTDTSVRPYLVVRGAEKAIELYRRVFGATIVEKPLVDPKSGKVVHAVLRLGGSLVVITDETPKYGNYSPASLGGTSVQLHVALPPATVDGVAERAVAAGMKVVHPVADQFYGARAGRLRDPFGHEWVVCAQSEVVSHRAQQRRLESFVEKHPPG